MFSAEKQVQVTEIFSFLTPRTAQIGRLIALRCVTPADPAWGMGCGARVMGSSDRTAAIIPVCAFWG